MNVHNREKRKKISRLRTRSAIAVDSPGMKIRFQKDCHCQYSRDRDNLEYNTKPSTSDKAFFSQSAAELCFQDVSPQGVYEKSREDANSSRLFSYILNSLW
jgi:hypothetical protein